MKKRKISLAIVSLICIMSIAFSLAFTASAGDLATKYSSMLVLGDSISTGYGLTGSSSSDPYSCASYGNRLAADLKLTTGKTYINRAVNGDDSSDLLKMLPSLESTVKKSKLIVVSIGGNDFLGNLPKIMSLITGKNYTTLQSCIGALSTLQQSDAAAALANPAVTACFKEILDNYQKNLNQIMALLYQYNPDARVLFLEQYNPACGVAAFSGLDSLCQVALGQLNEIMRTCASANNHETVNVPSVIDCAAMARTNILSYDIHPNAAGHGEIYALLLQTLMYDKPAVQTASTETAQQPAETKAPETTVKPVETKAPETTKPAETKAPETTVKLTDDSAASITTEAPVTEFDPMSTIHTLIIPETRTPSETEAPATETEAPAESSGEETTDTGKKGCKSAVVGGVALIAVIGSALILRRKED